MAKKRILLIEDDEDVYDFLQPYLADKGFEVAVAKSGKEGLEQIEKFKPGLVILDLMMPEIDGFGVLRILAGSRSPDVPKIIVLSAVQKMEGVEESLRLGASAYLLKPVDNDKLLEKIQSLI